MRSFVFTTTCPLCNHEEDININDLPKGILTKPVISHFECEKCEHTTPRKVPQYIIELLRMNQCS